MIKKMLCWKVKTTRYILKIVMLPTIFPGLFYKSMNSGKIEGQEDYKANF